MADNIQSQDLGSLMLDDGPSSIIDGVNVGLDIIKYITSVKGKKLLCLGSFIMYKSRKYQNTEYWECQNKKKTKCKYRVHVVSNSNPPEIIKETGEHNHCANFGAVDSKEAVNK